MESVSKYLRIAIVALLVSISVAISILSVEINYAKRSETVVNIYKKGYNEGYNKGLTDALTMYLLLEEKEGHQAPSIIPQVPKGTFEKPLLRTSQ